VVHKCGEKKISENILPPRLEELIACEASREYRRKKSLPGSQSNPKVLFIKKKLFLRDPAEGTLIFRKTEN
jgi:hypothetical protein